MGKSPNDAKLIDWPYIKKLLQPGTQVDVQFSDADEPLPYTVVMTLDTPLIFCRAIEDVRLPFVEEGATPMMFIPATRDLCSLRVVIKQQADNCAYLALSPIASAQILKRRRAIRIKSADDISYRVRFEGKSNIYKGIAVQDIGRGGVGLLVYAASPIQEGMQAEIEIVLPQASEKACATGSVSYCIQHGNLARMYRIGIRFTTISPRDKQMIAMYIDSSLKAEKSSIT
ncbi:PilZ domain-containing protein [Candidatus Aquicultor secundus]|nr:PilZ domain-containing protein [Candidatus Aquicultor secundus]NCO65153.1 PilZ domain-containing protein [Solirubrobacter sp.]